MPVPSTTVRAIVTRWADKRRIAIPHGTTFRDADALDALSLCDATQGWLLRSELDSIKDFITRQDSPALTLRERMSMTLGPVSQVEEYSTGTGTTVRATQSRTPRQVELWTLDDLPEIPDIRMAAIPTETQDTINTFSKNGLSGCTCEGDVCSGFYRVLKFACECVNQGFVATASTADTIGKPDLVVWKASTTPPRQLALVIECKTPWAFPADVDTRLDEIFNSCQAHHWDWKTNSDNLDKCPPELTFPRKVFHAVRQLYGYLSCNQRRFGILSTFTTTFLFKRGDGGKLFISKGIASDQLHPLTLLEAIARLLLQDNPPPDDNLSEADPSPTKDLYAQVMPQQSHTVETETAKTSKKSTPAKRKASGADAPSEEDDRELVLIFAPSEADDRELVLITELPDYQVIANGGNSSIVATELDDIAVAIKAVDTCKQGDLINDLHHECQAYAALVDFQGDFIPKLVRPAPVVLWEGMLDGLVLSLIKGQTLEAMGEDGIAAIPLECRLQAVRNLGKIHGRGVLHGDLAERNLMWLQDNRPRIVFVDFGNAVTSCDVSDSRFKREEAGLCAMLQIGDDSRFDEDVE